MKQRIVLAVSIALLWGLLIAFIIIDTPVLPG